MFQISSLFCKIACLSKLMEFDMTMDSDVVHGGLLKGKGKGLGFAWR